MLNEVLTSSAEAWADPGRHVHRDGGQRGKIKNKVKFLFKLQQFQTYKFVSFLHPTATFSIVLVPYYSMRLLAS